MEMAAVALTHGWDPLAFLALAPGDMSIAASVIARARRLDNERRAQDINLLARAIHHGQEVIVSGD